MPMQDDRVRVWMHTMANVRHSDLRHQDRYRHTQTLLPPTYNNTSVLISILYIQVIWMLLLFTCVISLSVVCGSMSALTYYFWQPWWLQLLATVLLAMRRSVRDPCYLEKEHRRTIHRMMLCLLRYDHAVSACMHNASQSRDSRPNFVNVLLCIIHSIGLRGQCGWHWSDCWHKMSCFSSFI